MEEVLLRYFSQFSQEKEAYFDTARNGVIRFEIAAAHLSAAVCNHDERKVLELCHFLLEARNADGLWDEYAYGLSNEGVGFSGLVTTSFVLLALVEAVRYRPNEDMQQCLIEIADVLYENEQNGYLQKAKINKSNVLNTNLLAAMAVKEISELLPQESVRKRLYDEMARRVIRKVLGFQSPSGRFPYHFDTYRVPILYQAMVTAQLRYFLRFYSDEILSFSWAQAIKALKTYYDPEGNIQWDRANCQDKEGAVWAYTFSLAALDHSDPLFKAVSGKVRQWQTKGLLPTIDKGNNRDPFYSAWAYFGLFWSLSSPESVQRYSWQTHFKWLLLKLEYFKRMFGVYIRYGKNMLYNYPFNSGAIENRFWFKK